MAKWTRATMARLHWEAILFGDGHNGAATQIHRCVEVPELIRSAIRESRKVNFTITYSYGDHGKSFDGWRELIKWLNSQDIAPPPKKRKK